MDRQQALLTGSKWYEGKPCRFGHGTERLTSNSCCKQCGMQKNAKYIQNRPDKRLQVRSKMMEKVGGREAWLEQRRAIRAMNADKFREQARARYSKNPDRHRAQSAASRLKRPEKIAKTSRLWKQKNRAYATAKERERQALRVSAMPPWADADAIHSFYLRARELSRNLGIPYEVDHIIPLKGKYVSGLHVESNLQVITAIENRRKGNRLI